MMTSFGLRIGITEITRLGMKESEMTYIANLITDILQGNEKSENTILKVIELRKSFNKIHYCY